MNCVFGEVKSVIVNGKSYDELFGVDINLLNGEQRKEFVNELLSMNENAESNLELSIEEHNNVEAQKQHYTINEETYFDMLKEHLLNISEHSSIIYYVITSRDILFEFQKILIFDFLNALYNNSDDDKDELFDRLEIESVINCRDRSEMSFEEIQIALDVNNIEEQLNAFNLELQQHYMEYQMQNLPDSDDTDSEDSEDSEEDDEEIQNNDLFEDSNENNNVINDGINGA